MKQMSLQKKKGSLIPVTWLTLPGIWGLLHIYLSQKHTTSFTMPPTELESVSEAMFLVFLSLLGLLLAKDLINKNKVARKVYLLSASALISLGIRHLGTAPLINSPGYWLNSIILTVSGVIVLVHLWSRKLPLTTSRKKLKEKNR
jgi:hypothetical protein